MNIKEQNINLLKKWDNEEEIETVECGGLGDEYEQCIQSLAIEIVRENLDTDIKTIDDEWANEIIDRENTNYGFSGAQVCMSRWFALRILEEGYITFIDRVKKEKPERLINCKKREIPQLTPEQAYQKGYDVGKKIMEKINND